MEDGWVLSSLQDSSQLPKDEWQESRFDLLDDPGMSAVQRMPSV